MCGVIGLQSWRRSERHVNSTWRLKLHKRRFHGSRYKFIILYLHVNVPRGLKLQPLLVPRRSRRNFYLNGMFKSYFACLCGQAFIPTSWLPTNERLARFPTDEWGGQRLLTWSAGLIIISSFFRNDLFTSLMMRNERENSPNTFTYSSWSSIHPPFYCEHTSKESDELKVDITTPRFQIPVLMVCLRVNVTGSTCSIFALLHSTSSTRVSQYQRAIMLMTDDA